MMSNKLSQEQIQQLYVFTRQHYVEHYDLQTELVDHLANGIELQMQENPNLNFDAALHNEFKKFGIFGFSDIVEKRSWALEKKYWKFIWKAMLSFFGIPKIIISLSMLYIVYQILLLGSTTEYTYLPLLILVPFVVLAIKVFKNAKMYKRKLKSNHKRWMLEERIFGYGSGMVLLNLIAQLMLNGRYILFVEHLPQFYVLLIAIGVTAIYLLGYLMIYFLPQRAEQFLSQQYPEYRLS
ncbi:MAG TPA: hypothetical protein VLZ11_05660 [Flavobacterium sp.]|nr:hypothetical protein [Flavobacterium sp.]